MRCLLRFSSFEKEKQIMSSAAAPKTLQSEDAVKEFYGKTIKIRSDLKTTVCESSKYPKFLLDAMKGIHEEVSSKYYGCGPVFPPAVKGIHVLDLGSGSGKDCYILSKLVGEEGSVTGLDMTDEQLAIAKKYIDYHTQLYGYSSPNVKYVKGNMEKMQDAGLDSDTFDLIVSNCVINLAKDKYAVLNEAYRVLKEGGELHFSDMYGDRDLPQNIREHELLWCECVAGALYWKDLLKLAKAIGFSTPRLVSASSISVEEKSYRDLLGEAKFVSCTYSLFKLPEKLSPPKTVTYNGGIEGFEEKFKFDHGITFQKGEEAHVKSELATILQASRYKQFFTFSDGENGVAKYSQLDKDPFELITEVVNETSPCCS